MTVTKAQKKATAKYEKDNYDKVLLRMPKGTKERIQKQSESVNGYIIKAITQALDNDEQNEVNKYIEIGNQIFN